MSSCFSSCFDESSPVSAVASTVFFLSPSSSCRFGVPRGAMGGALMGGALSSSCRFGVPRGVTDGGAFEISTLLSSSSCRFGVPRGVIDGGASSS